MSLFKIYASSMFSLGFYEQWNNMHKSYLKEKNGEKFFLTSDKIIQSFAYGVVNVWFGPVIYTKRLIEKVKEWEYEKK
jgi:hypothetical protein